MIGLIVAGIALAAVAIILFAGIASMWIGGNTDREWSNRLMRYRVLAQAVAIVIILIVIWVSTGR